MATDALDALVDVTPPRQTFARRLGMAARVVAAALVAAMGVIHFHLWSSGYKHIHIIGIFFLLNAIGGIVLALALLAVPTRLLSVVAALAAIFTAGTLLGLVLSRQVGLFGFKEYSGVPYETESIVLESVGIALTAILAAVYARATLAWYRQEVDRPLKGARPPTGGYARRRGAAYLPHRGSPGGEPGPGGGETMR
jgi:hypothetical protein